MSDKQEYLIIVMNDIGKFDCVWNGIYTSDEADDVIRELKNEDEKDKIHYYTYRKYYFIQEKTI